MAEKTDHKRYKNSHEKYATNKNKNNKLVIISDVMMMSSIYFLLSMHVFKCGFQSWHDGIPHQQIAIHFRSPCRIYMRIDEMEGGRERGRERIPYL